MRLITTILFLFFVLPFLLAQTVFIEDTQNNFTDIYEGETAFADVDGDGDQDLFVLGYSEGFDVHAKLYKNNGEGLFTLADTNIPGLGYSSMAFADVDDDNDVDLLLAGQTNTFTPAATYL